MSKDQATWNNIFKKVPLRNPAIDNWLEKYLPIINESRDIEIIDLGCGFGNDTLYLTQRGFKVLSCDFSQEALNRLSHFMESPNIRLLDMRESLPFTDNSIKIIISDLSIHYFSEETTFSIIKELKRVLMPGGAFICRVNSAKELDKNFERVKIEENFYRADNKDKRYFNETDVRKFFADFSIGEIYSYIMPRYRYDKYVLDFICTLDR